ncbi:L-threonylcarbamoyladenylate synthase [Candidatus Contubernalis alkaliaceticus]|uniref:L-threonylcarbamoyladenylate synthase n=1 Tax=Candidatus Contubernalis alkaliaceticus TaxID=338645 RepID=UPI001F4C14A7|nr:threonylcarbamoyl-AMP synthase [Candidatus Contubernalis alkalaceticus]
MVANARDLKKAKKDIQQAAEIIRRGGLVAFPTETVYGLGANAFSAPAVERIFRAKGRPGDNPLIVHISGGEGLGELVSEVPQNFRLLAEKYWPGPLTMVLPKGLRVPREVTAGLDTVALRMPQHPVALALIRTARLPIAAPSANLSGRPSPTTAEHVLEDLAGRIQFLLDGGPCTVGLESTVLDLTHKVPLLLRPGGVTLEQLQETLGEVQVLDSMEFKDEAPPSPGLKYRHYAPRAPMFLVEGEPSRVVKEIQKICRENRLKGRRVGLLVTEENRAYFRAEAIEVLGFRSSPEEMASRLFDSLRRLDTAGVDLILAETFEKTGMGLALMNRLCRAAQNRIIKAR